MTTLIQQLLTTLILPQILQNENFSSSIFSYLTLYLCNLGQLIGSLSTHRLVESALGRRLTVVGVCGVQMGLALLVLFGGDQAQIGLLFGQNVAG
jgi:MFS-type transporter involved in bile tolerance (Atg22 family)